MRIETQSVNVFEQLQASLQSSSLLANRVEEGWGNIKDGYTSAHAPSSSNVGTELSTTWRRPWGLRPDDMLVFDTVFVSTKPSASASPRPALTCKALRCRFAYSIALFTRSNLYCSTTRNLPPASYSISSLCPKVM